ncbi:hypothetical protein AJ79_09872 [Helicocarpus griseus UAMH5409]|uniref:Major facilitator superfamily (MFS) profile domain-containing protein n=1 Tax=Helicocarpus griseus UAMH5409 TaxID=1447875 RepID=A0A2B7WGK3_9EURO|nr:hypothetical protein AJ79_09872 [Helicocarpus griseus UAMH5409]
MDDLSRDIEKAELSATPTAADNAPPSESKEHAPLAPSLSRSPSPSSSAASSASGSSDSSSTRQPYSLHTTASVQTQRDLERHPTALSRIATHRSQHSNTVGAGLRSRPPKRPLPPFGAGKPYPPLLPEREEYVVEFDGPDDPLHPQNWTMKRKVATALILGYTTMISSFTSSLFSTATTSVSAIYGVSTQVGILGLSLYVLGFATGPLVWAPLSELKGRRMPLLLSMFGFTVFQFGGAAAKDLQTIMICRFFGGFFGACPIAVVAAVFSDMFDTRLRGLAITVFSMTVFTGPLLAPFVGGFIVDSHLGWRWTQFLPGILGASALVLDTFLLQETYPPVVLVEKASELRRRTRNWGIHAKQEEIEIDLRELIEKNFSRPLKILATEPIVLLLSIYLAFIYGILYLFMTAYPIVFQQIHGMSPGVGGLPYFGMIIGQLLGGLAIILSQPWYTRKLAANNGVPIPEWRLPHVIVGGISFAGGLFWFGWSGYRADVHWIVPTLSGLMTGFGLLVIFLQALNYIIDAYLMFAASAIAANTLLRSIAGAAFPLFSQKLFQALGVNWAGTLIGCVAALLAPIPVIFYIYGARIRGRSKFSPVYTAPEREFEFEE